MYRRCTATASGPHTINKIVNFIDTNLIDGFRQYSVAPTRVNIIDNFIDGIRFILIMAVGEDGTKALFSLFSVMSRLDLQ